MMREHHCWFVLGKANRFIFESVLRSSEGPFILWFQELIRVLTSFIPRLDILSVQYDHAISFAPKIQEYCDVSFAFYVEMRIKHKMKVRQRLGLTFILHLAAIFAICRKERLRMVNYSMYLDAVIRGYHAYLNE